MEKDNIFREDPARELSVTPEYVSNIASGKANNPTPIHEEIEAHRELRDALLEHSRKSMAPIIARYLRGSSG